MAKDISEYLDFGPPGIKKRSIKSVLNTPMTVNSWEIKNGRYGVYAAVDVTLPEGHFLINIGHDTVVGQLDAISMKKEALGETDMSFTCVPRRVNGVIKLCPVEQ